MAGRLRDSPGHQHQVPVGLGLQAFQQGELHLGLVAAVGLQLAGQQADLLGQLLHRLGGLGPRDLDVTGGPGGEGDAQNSGVRVR